MNERDPIDPPAESRDETLSFERIIPRVLRNMLVVGVLLIAPVFWFYGRAGSIGFALGAAVSYANFHSLKRGVEGLADRIVNRGFLWGLCVPVAALMAEAAWEGYMAFRS